MSDAHGHDDHGHHGSPFIQHHYDDGQHQFDSGKLGIWLFLAQEVLFFAALFVGYIILRAQHPEIFEYASLYLDTTMGAVNTVVLIGSSFTAAYAVRAAQLNQQKILLLCLGVTLLCAFTFLGVKYFEYSHKGHIKTLYGVEFNPTEDPNGVKYELPEGVAAEPGIPTCRNPKDEKAIPCPAKTNMFFTLYFAMTGLHGIHVLAGVFVFLWLFLRARKGHFTPEYYGPVDYAALYWHLVDLIWIFLFPLFYLI